MDWLSRVRSEPATGPAGYQPPQVLYSPVTPQTAAKTRDPNAPDYRYQVNQKCVYERELPGGSYITAHIQRLQSGYYDSPVVHEDLIENVRFIALNFVFHPSRRDYRFKSAEISVAIHHTSQDGLTPLDRVRNSIGLDDRSDHDHDHATQTDTVSNALVRSKEYLPPRRRKTKPTTSRPKFIRHAPHLLFGSISPETLDWNFNVAGSIGVSQGPASAAFKPSYGTKGSYKVYEMMRIQGSVRTLRSWHGHEYDVEDGEIVWTLEENRLQKSGLPREFTFVMMLTKGSGGIEPSDDITLDIDVHPKVSGPLGGTYPKAVTGLHRFQPFRKDPVDLDQEIGQVFEPSIPGRGFNFASLATNFDDFVWLPGTTYSTTDNPNVQQHQQSSRAATQPQEGQQLPQQPQRSASQSQQQQKQITSQPSTETTLQLRVILENARGSPVPITNGNLHHSVLPYLHLKAPSRGPSPLPPSVAGSRRSKRSITIKSQAPSPSQAYSERKRHTYADPHSHARHASGSSVRSQPQLRKVSHTHSLRKTRSRSGLDKEYIRSESPAETREVQNRSQTFHDARTEISTPSKSTNEREAESVPQPSLERDRGKDRSRDKTPQHGDEHESKDVHEKSYSEEQFADMQQLAIGRLALPHDHEENFTPASRYNRFPSLSHTYSRAAQAPGVAQAYEQADPAAQTPPRTLSPHSSAHSSPLAGTEQSQRWPSVPREQRVLESEAEPRPLTPPQVQGRDFEPVTPLSNQQSAPESPREPTLSPSTMLDPLTPPSHRQHQPEHESPTAFRHQHSSSLSPPSIPTTSSKTQPANATPRFKRPVHDSADATGIDRQPHDQFETGNWNDTPPEWTSPTGSGSNTPARNRSLRTRKATARALALQDQLTPHTQAGKTTQRGSDEYYRTPNITIPARGHSLRIQAGPQARAHGTPPEQQSQQLSTANRSRETGNLAYATLPSQQKQDPATSNHKATASTSSAAAPRYTYPTVPRSAAALATGVPSQARAQTQSSSNSSRPQSKDGKHKSSILRKPEGGAYNFTQLLLQDPELELEQESPPEYVDASDTRKADLIQGTDYTQEQERQLVEMERDAMDMQREAIAARAASQSASGSDGNVAASGVHTHMQVTQPVEMGLDSPTLPTHPRTSRDTNRSKDRDTNRENARDMSREMSREMPPVTKFANIDTGSGSDSQRASDTRNSRRSSKESTANSNTHKKSRSSSKTRRESTSLIAKAQKYMRDAGYGSWVQGQGQSDRAREGPSTEAGGSQAEGKASFEPPAGRGVLGRQESGFEPPAGRGVLGRQEWGAVAGDRKVEAGDTRALGVSGFIPAADNRAGPGHPDAGASIMSHIRAPSGDARAAAALAGVKAEEHDRGLVSGLHEYEEDAGSYDQDTPTYSQHTPTYPQHTPQYSQDNSSEKYELDATPTATGVRGREDEYDDEREALLGNRESQASFVSSNKDWRNTAGWATNMM